MTEIITGLVTSFVTLAGSYFIFKNNDKSNQLKYITEERQKWREKIRELSVSFMSGSYVDNEFLSINVESVLINIREQVAVRLNPDDEEDNYILCLMDCYIEHKDYRQTIRKELSKAFASLLKHDWERAKNESKMESNSSKLIFFLISLLLVLLIFGFFSSIPEKVFYLNFKDLQFYEFNNICIIVFILMIFIFYNLFKFAFWYYKYKVEKGLKDFLKSKHESNDKKLNNCFCALQLEKDVDCLCKCKNIHEEKNISFCSIWNKYLGFIIRRKVSRE